MRKLYHYRNNIWTVCVRLALAEKRLDYDLVHVDLFAGEQFKPEFLALNPNHKVPCLVDDGVAIGESWIINEYLEDRHPDPPLLPRDPAGRARARLLADFANRFFFAHAYDLLIELVVKPRVPAMGAPNPAVVATAKEAVPRALARFERELAARPYLTGDGFGLVDCMVVPYIAGLADLGESIPADHEHLRRWFERARERPSYRTAEVDGRFTATLLRESPGATAGGA